MNQKQFKSETIPSVSIQPVGNPIPTITDSKKCNQNKKNNSSVDVEIPRPSSKDSTDASNTHSKTK